MTTSAQKTKYFFNYLKQILLQHDFVPLICRDIINISEKVPVCGYKCKLNKFY
jgi:hypothetical protein